MKALVPILITLIVLGVFAVVLPILPKRANRPGALPYRRKDYLLTAAERSFFGVLVSVVGNQFYVFPKIRLADLVFLPKGTTNRQTHLNRVTAKHVDFVLCDRKSVAPVLIIELDDSSHARDERRARDVFVDEVLRAAGLPILRVAAKQSYSPPEIRESVLNQLKGLA